MGPAYRASKNRSQGREGWCILFHHPLRRNPGGKPLRVRRGLGTTDGAEADALVEQMNRLLADDSFWTPAARERALQEIDARIVSIFYDDLTTTSEDYWAKRDEVIPLPTRSDGFTRVLLVGPTGAGKTTVARQIIGSHPKRDRFPSTSTAKTTVCDVEIVMASGPYHAVVSFLSRDRVRHYIEECVAASVSAAAEGQGEAEIARRLLEHAEQRFRLSYILGTFTTPVSLAESDMTVDFDDDDDDEEDGLDAEAAPEPEVAEVTDEERKRLEQRVRAYVERIAALGSSVRGELATHLGMAPDAMMAGDRDAFLELLDERLRENTDAQSLIDDLVDEVETRFALLEQGALERDRSNWPVRWTYQVDNRAAFIRTVNRFSGNNARNFGRLLTPLVQGFRVAGPFRPDWLKDGSPKIVLLDGEGLGHTPDSASSLPTALTKRYESADVILLVDSATQPMVAGALTVLRSVSSSGHDSKLVVAFTHFEQVKGDNLPNAAAKRNHVRASLDNAINGIDVALGSGAGRSLRRHLERRVLYLSRLDKPTPPPATTQQFGELLSLFREAVSPPPPERVAPIYDLANLVLGATAAAQQFHNTWNTRLPSEHWTRVKALTRRLAYLGEDQYDTLRPVADLIAALQEQARIFIRSPRSWEPADAPQDLCESAVDLMSREFFSRLHVLVNERLAVQRIKEWQTAHERRGPGSGNLRKQDVRAINTAAAPIPGVVPTRDAVTFLDEVRSLFREAATSAGAKIV